ncbi:MAG: hypothetical protein HZC19_03705, partial [Candidatus Omnitrophica bacterium]|nr:hypothetical protein [Candidatus Omnitrophota bacterium]
MREMLYNLAAHQLKESIAKKETTPSKIAENVIERIKTVNAKTNSYI